LTPEVLGSRTQWTFGHEFRRIGDEIIVGFGHGPVSIEQRRGEREKPTEQEDRRQEYPKQQDLLIP
jgi:hypothetical protein